MATLEEHGMDYGDIEDVIQAAMSDENATHSVDVKNWKRKNGEKYVVVEISLGKAGRSRYMKHGFKVSKIVLYSEFVNPQVSDYWVKGWTHDYADNYNYLFTISEKESSY